MRWLFRLFFYGLILWFGGFAWFWSQVPRFSLASTQVTDGIVVLTGGADRIAYGFGQLEDGLGRVLLITGVGEHNDLAVLAAEHAGDFDYARHASKITLDPVAKSTFANAAETTKWVQEQNIATVRLVTANYHMPRSLAAFRRAMPSTVFIADPVFPEPFKLDSWWKDGVSREIMLMEYHKYLAVLASGWMIDAYDMVLLAPHLWDELRERAERLTT